MSKLRLVILSVMFVAAGLEISQTTQASAMQSQSPVIKLSIDLSVAKTDISTILIAKKCTIKRYRRPH